MLCPAKFYIQLIVDFYVQGIDVSGVTPENLGFVFSFAEDDKWFYRNVQMLGVFYGQFLK